MFTINFVQIKRAFSIGIITAVLAILVYINQLGSISLIDWKVLANTGVYALIGVFISSLQSFLTTSKGEIIGLMKVE